MCVGRRYGRIQKFHLNLQNDIFIHNQLKMKAKQDTSTKAKGKRWKEITFLI